MSHLGERVSALVDGELNHHERDRALSHLTFCADCRAEVDAVRALKSRLRSLDGPAMPADLTMSLLRMSEPGGRYRRVSGPFRPRGPSPGPRSRACTASRPRTTGLAAVPEAPAVREGPATSRWASPPRPWRSARCSSWAGPIPTRASCRRSTCSPTSTETPRPSAGRLRRPSRPLRDPAARHRVSGGSHAAGTGGGHPAHAAPPDEAESEDTGLHLLREAAIAGRTRGYSGTQYVTTWGRSGAVSSVLEVRNVPGRGLMMHARPSDPVRTADPGTPAGGMTSPSEFMLEVLARNYRVVAAGRGHACGRPARLANVLRQDGTVAARYWLDEAGGWCSAANSSTATARSSTPAPSSI